MSAMSELDQALTDLAQLFVDAVKESFLQGSWDAGTVERFVEHYNLEDEVKDRVRTILGGK